MLNIKDIEESSTVNIPLEVWNEIKEDLEEFDNCIQFIRRLKQCIKDIESLGAHTDWDKGRCHSVGMIKKVASYHKIDLTNDIKRS